MNTANGQDEGVITLDKTKPSSGQSVDVLMISPKEAYQALMRKLDLSFVGTRKVEFTQMSTDALLTRVIAEAQAHYNGHFTILSLTTGFKAAFGTPDLAGGNGRHEVSMLPPFGSLRDALIFALAHDIAFP